jgi:hypothetical protein
MRTACCGSATARPADVGRAAVPVLVATGEKACIPRRNSCRDRSDERKTAISLKSHVIAIVYAVMMCD